MKSINTSGTRTGPTAGGAGPYPSIHATRTWLNSKTRALALGLFLGGAAACGASEPDIHGQLQLPEGGHARMSLSPALDVSSVIDPALLDRIIIDEIVVNVADVRLLGSDPRVPTGGLRLAGGERQISSIDDGISFRMPGGMSLEDLALFVELAPSNALEGASVIVRARLFESAQEKSVLQLRQEKTEPDPDGSPAKGDPNKAEPDPDGSPATGDPRKTEPDPDGSPAKGDPNKAEPDPDGSPAMGPNCEPDPDGSPAMRPCIKRSLRRGLVDANGFVSFELRGSDTADLLVSLSASHPFNVVVGIPAGRWFTPEAVATLESALDQVPVDGEALENGGAEAKPVVVSSSPRDMASSQKPHDGNSLPGDRDEDYRLLGGDADPTGIRKH